MEAHVPLALLREVEGRARPAVINVPLARIVPPHTRNKLALYMFMDGVYIRPMVFERLSILSHTVPHERLSQPLPERVSYISTWVAL